MEAAHKMAQNLQTPACTATAKATENGIGPYNKESVSAKQGLRILVWNAKVQVFDFSSKLPK